MKNARTLLFTALALSLVGCFGERRVVSTETRSLAVEDADMIEIDVVAGDLEVVGDGTLDTVELEVLLATSWLGESGDEDAIAAFDVALEPTEEGRIVARVTLDGAPDGYFADVIARVPTHLAASVYDTSGDIEITDVASLRLQDGSGDVDVLRVAGAIHVEDGSGDLRFEEVGPATITDTSGGLRLYDVTGDVEIDDEDGDIWIERVSGAVVVRDGSGELRCVDVEGGVTITDDSGGNWLERVHNGAHVSDGSGDIVAIDVDGLTIDADTSGEVDVR